MQFNEKLKLKLIAKVWLAIPAFAVVSGILLSYVTTKIGLESTNFFFSGVALGIVSIGAALHYFLKKKLDNARRLALNLIGQVAYISETDAEVLMTAPLEKIESLLQSNTGRSMLQADFIAAIIRAK